MRAGNGQDRRADSPDLMWRNEPGRKKARYECSSEGASLIALGRVATKTRLEVSHRMTPSSLKAFLSFWWGPTVVAGAFLGLVVFVFRSVEVCGV